MIETQYTTSAIIEQIKERSTHASALQAEIGKIIIGQEEAITFLLIALLCNGHILLEGVPGVAKTTMIKALTKALGLTFSRIQFTPDLLPSDLIGTLIYNQKTQEFETKKGPIFANLILADEINRAPAKVQSALLEAMQEHQVTIGSHSYVLEEPFLVFATQNPIEQEGTYRLPEAQVDRFIVKVIIGYCTELQERELLRRSITMDTITPVCSQQELLSMQALVRHIYLDEKIIDYIVRLVSATRDPAAYQAAELASYIVYGVSPRATLALGMASRAHAFLHRRHFVTPDDVKAVASAVLRHRIGLSYEADAARMSAEAIVTQLLRIVPCP